MWQHLGFHEVKRGGQGNITNLYSHISLFQVGRIDGSYFFCSCFLCWLLRICLFLHNNWPVPVLAHCTCIAPSNVTYSLSFTCSWKIFLFKKNSFITLTYINCLFFLQKFIFFLDCNLCTREIDKSSYSLINFPCKLPMFYIFFIFFNKLCQSWIKCSCSKALELAKKKKMHHPSSVPRMLPVSNGNLDVELLSGRQAPSCMQAHTLIVPLL